MEVKEYVAIAVVVIPIALAIFRLVWNMGSVQSRISNNGHNETIRAVVDVAINAAEQWSKNNSEATGEEKKAKALDLARLAAMKLGVPASLVTDEIVAGYIESALSKVKWD